MKTRGIAPNDRLALVVAGVVAVTAGLAWWLLDRRRRSRRISAGLKSFDPVERARAGIALVDGGLRSAARPMLEHVAGEADPRVRTAIALAVGRHRAASARRDDVRRLRAWAAQELAGQHRPGAPREPAPDLAPPPDPWSGSPRSSPVAPPDPPAEASDPIRWRPDEPR